MPNYEIEFSAFEPVFGKIDSVPANDDLQARDFAEDEIANLYPEYVDTEITRVIEIKD